MQVFFDEGRHIRLEFEDNWAVIDYDAPHTPTAFYRTTVERIGAGLSAVDFVVNPHETPSRLLLIEVKDFRQHETANRPRLKPGALAVEITRNVLHTLAVLYPGVRSRHRMLRTIEEVVLPTPSRLQVVLLLEEDPLPTARADQAERLARINRRIGVQTELQQRLDVFSIETSLYRCGEIPDRDGWTATALPLTRY